MEIKELLGKTLTAINVNGKNGRDTIHFVVEGGNDYVMYHKQDCCESVSIDDINGDLDDLIGSPIMIAEVNANDWAYSPSFDDDYDDDNSCTWTYYKLATIKGYVDIRWYGSSNGYYSESVDFEEVGSEDDLSGIKQNN